MKETQKGTVLISPTGVLFIMSKFHYRWRILSKEPGPLSFWGHNNKKILLKTLKAELGIVSIGSV